MKIILSEDQFITEFTRDFLDRFYDTIHYFNIDAIATDAKPLIIKRINELKKYVNANSDLVDYVLANEDLMDNLYKYDATQWNQLSKFNENECWKLGVDEMKYFFIVDLFEITSRPIQYACRLNKGEYPNGDLCAGDDIEINVDLNRILLQWARQKDFEFDF